MRVELLGKQGEKVNWEDVPSNEVPDAIAIHSRLFVRDETKFYTGTKYVEASVLRIEKRAENSSGAPPDGIERRKSAGA